MRNIEIVILVAGKSTRNYPLSKGIAHKSLLPLGSKKIIDYITNYIADTDVQDVTFTVSDENSKHSFEDCIYYEKTSLSNKNIKFVYQHEPKGLAHAIATASSVSENRDMLVVFPDDILIFSDGTNPIKLLLEKYQIDTESKNIFLTRKVKDPSRWGIVENGFLREKPQTSTSSDASVMGFIIDYNVIQNINNNIKCIVNSKEESHYSKYLNYMIENHQTNKIQTVDIDQFDVKYLDCGTTKNYEKALIYFLLNISDNKDSNIKMAKKTIIG